MGRAPCCDKANVKKGPWSPEEDAKLKSYIEQHGTGGNWIALPQKIGLKRCGKSCRLRWLNYLRPNIKHGDFSEEEDRLICSLYVSIGSRWSIIAAQLPGRTDNDIKNYWNTRLKKKLFGKHHERQKQVVRRGRKIKTEIGNSMGFVFDDRVYNQSSYLPELSSVLNSPAPYTNYQDVAVPCYDNHHESIRNSLTKLVGERLSDQPIQLIPSQFPSNSQQVYGHAGDDLCRTNAAQFVVDGAGLAIPQGQICPVVGELENLVYNNTAAFDNGLLFLCGDDDTKNGSNGMIDDYDWGEMSSLISAPSYPSMGHELLGSSYLEQQKQ